MKGNPESRSVDLGNYIVNTGATVRSAAKKFGISKSTVHKDVTKRLPQINKSLYIEVEKILKINKQERHMRGGNATKMRWHKIQSQE